MTPASATAPDGIGSMRVSWLLEVSAAGKIMPATKGKVNPPCAVALDYLHSLSPAREVRNGMIMIDHRLPQTCHTLQMRMHAPINS